MIVGLGTDLVDTRRIARELARGKWLAHDGVFTPTEIALCHAARFPERQYAKCFAAKEATLKALGAEVSDLGILSEVQVGFHGDAGQILLCDRLQEAACRLGASTIHLSLAATSESVAAMVILESDRRPL